MKYESKNEDCLFSIDTDEDNIEWNSDWEEEFYNSEITKEVEELQNKILKLKSTRNYDEVLKLQESLLFKIPQQAQLWKSLGGENDDFYYNYQLFEQLLRAYVVLLKTNKMPIVLSTVLKLYTILEMTQADIDRFKENYSRFYNDIENMVNIYKFLQKNQNYPQKNIFKELSLDGKKSSYMLKWAENLKQITRSRHKNTWLLNII